MNHIVLNVMKKRGKKAVEELDQNSACATQLSEDLLMKLVQDNKNTEYGKKYHFDEIHSIEDYKEKVPFSVYDDYAPYIERMIEKNEKNLLSVYPIVHYAVSSGSVGVPKHIPVSSKTIECYNKYSCNLVFGRMDMYFREKYGRSWSDGKGLNTLEVREMKTKNGVIKGPISSTTSRANKNLLPYVFSSPLDIVFTNEVMDLKYLQIRYGLEEKNISFMLGAFITSLVDLMTYMQANWEELCDEIEKGTLKEDANIPKDVRKKLERNLKPNPKRAKELRKEFEKGFDSPIIPRIWKRMSWIYAIGTGGFACYTDKMRKYSGNVPIHFSVYGASEALIAVARNVNEGEFVLIPDSGFYEFIPMDSEDETTTYTMDQLEVGKDYEIVITNLAGFYRYKIKDVVRVTGYHGESPKLKFVYRKNQMISIAGEKTNDEAVAWSVKKFARETGCRIDDYSVYPDTDSEPGRYVVLMEPDHIMPKEKLPEYAKMFEEHLGQANPSFGAKVKNGVLSHTELKFVQQETYELYRDVMMMRGVSGNQLKPVRVIDTPVKEKFFFGLVETE